MDKKRFHDLTIKFTDHLTDTAGDFLIANMEAEENTSDIINLIVGSHAGSMANAMYAAAQGNENIIKIIDKFVKEFLESMKKIMPGNGVTVEVLRGSI